MLSGAALAANGKGGGLRRSTAAIRLLAFLVVAALLSLAPTGSAVAANDDERAYEAANVPFRQGDYAAAKQLYAALLEHQDAGGFKADDPRRLSVLYQLARCEYQLGEYRAAYDHAKPVSDALDKSGEAPAERVFDIDNFVASLADGSTAGKTKSCCCSACAVRRCRCPAWSRSSSIRSSCAARWP